MNARFQARMLAAGLCPNCGDNPRGDATQLCDACRASQRERVQRRRLERIAQGLCVECARRPLDGKRRCRPCMDEKNAARRTSRNAQKTTPEPREPPRRTAMESETQDTPESSGLALVGPTKPKPKNNQFKHEETPLCSRIVTQYELRKVGAWVP
jgi:NMD protein affecting ribosome stability and mRNA decay